MPIIVTIFTSNLNFGTLHLLHMLYQFWETTFYSV